MLKETFYGSKSAPEIDIEVLTDEAMKLLRMEIDDLYATLGGQMLGQNLPSRVAGMVSYLSAARSAFQVKSLGGALSSVPARDEWGRGLGMIHEELKQGGMELFREASADLRNALYNEDILSLSDKPSRSTTQMILMIVGATLRMPRNFDPVSATITAILLRLGLRDFCRRVD